MARRTTPRSILGSLLARPLAGLLLAATSLGLAATSASCMSIEDELEGEILLSTQPTDWRDEVIYQLLVDRFANGDPGNDFNVDLTAQGKWHGGDWAGVEQQLDYLEELGVTTLWISPIVKNVDSDAGFDGYHGYWAQDLTALNPHFGDLAALRRLVFAAHDRKMKVIVDIVTNHMGQAFYYDINRNGEPDERVSGSGTTSGVTHVNEYDPDFDPRGVQSRTSLGEAGPAPIIFQYDPASNHVPPEPAIFADPRAYHRKGRTYNFEDPQQLLLGDFPGGLKDVATEQCAGNGGLPVRETMVDVYARWVELTDVDGFRIDTVKHVERGFWRYFSQKMRQRLEKQGKKRFFMFGEAFDGRDQLIGAFTKTDLPPANELEKENECVTDGKEITGDQLDSVFYFSQYFTAIRDVFQLGQGTKRIEDLWARKPINYGTEAPKDGIGVAPTQALVNFIDNHDVPRFLWSGAGVDSLHSALAFIYTAEGIPCVYYGTEQQLEGGNDPANREDLWDTGFATDGATFRFMKKLGSIRKGSKALRRGNATVRWASERVGEESDAGVFAFDRSGGDAGDDYALMVFNAHRTKASAPTFNGAAMPVGAPPGTVLKDALGMVGGEFTVASDGTILIEPLPPQSAMILRPK